MCRHRRIVLIGAISISPACSRYDAELWLQLFWIFCGKIFVLPCIAHWNLRLHANHPNNSFVFDLSLRMVCSCSTSDEFTICGCWHFKRCCVCSQRGESYEAGFRPQHHTLRGHVHNSVVRLYSTSEQIDERYVHS